MLSEVVGRDEGEDVRLKVLDIGVVEQLDGRILDGSVHAFGLAVGPWMVRLGEPVLDAELGLKYAGQGTGGWGRGGS